MAVVAAQVMARRGPAVEEPVWGDTKLAEAELWVAEELAEAQREKDTTRHRANVAYCLSIVLAGISVAGLIIAAGTFGLRWWG